MGWLPHAHADIDTRTHACLRTRMHARTHARTHAHAHTGVRKHWLGKRGLCPRRAAAVNVAPARELWAAGPPRSPSTSASAGVSVAVAVLAVGVDETVRGASLPPRAPAALGLAYGIGYMCVVYAALHK